MSPGKDAGSPNSSAIWATEDAAWRRLGPSGRVKALAGAGEDNLRHVAVARGAQQEANRLAEVLRSDHLLAGHLSLGELGHRRVDEAGRQRRALDAGVADLAVGRLGEVDHRGL